MVSNHIVYSKRNYENKTTIDVFQHRMTLIARARITD